MKKRSLHDALLIWLDPGLSLQIMSESMDEGITPHYWYVCDIKKDCVDNGPYKSRTLAQKDIESNRQQAIRGSEFLKKGYSHNNIQYPKQRKLNIKKRKLNIKKGKVQTSNPKVASMGESVGTEMHQHIGRMLHKKGFKSRHTCFNTLSFNPAPTHLTHRFSTTQADRNRKAPPAFIAISFSSLRV